MAEIQMLPVLLRAFETRQLRPFFMSLFARVLVMAISLQLTPGIRGAS
jgi:hypothetical protein